MPLSPSSDGEQAEQPRVPTRHASRRRATDTDNVRTNDADIGTSLFETTGVGGVEDGEAAEERSDGRWRPRRWRRSVVNFLSQFVGIVGFLGPNMHRAATVTWWQRTDLGLLFGESVQPDAKRPLNFDSFIQKKSKRTKQKLDRKHRAD